ncbi:MAG: hypothetical protein ACREJQ_08410 [bacterium]
MNGFPDIALAPIESIRPYEVPKDARVERVKSAILQDHLLRNPVLVAPLLDGFLLLDGTNRYTALTDIGAPHILVQRVDLHSPQILLNSWAHQLPYSSKATEIIEKWKVRHRVSVAEHRIESSPLPAYALQPNFLLAAVFDSSSCRIYSRDAGINERADLLVNIVAHLTQVATLSRTNPETALSFSATDTHSKTPDPGQSQTLFLFYPTFSKEQVQQLAHAGVRLPSGISRFIIPGRALGVDFPLETLRSPASLQEKSRSLRDHIEARRNSNRIRFYSEPVYFFND